MSKLPDRIKKSLNWRHVTPSRWLLRVTSRSIVSMSHLKFAIKSVRVRIVKKKAGLHFDCLVVTTGHNLLAICLETSNRTLVALLGYPVECFYALTVWNVPETNVKVKRATDDSLWVKVKTSDRALVACQLLQTVAFKIPYTNCLISWAGYDFLMIKL